MKVVNKRFHKGSPDDVYIGRPSALGNPYSHMGDTLASFKVGTRDEAVDKYEAWLRAKLEQGDKEVSAAFSLLKEDSVLTCWCKPAKCHGDVLARIWAERNSMSQEDRVVGYYQREVAQEFVSQLDSANRFRDWTRVHYDTGLEEEGNGIQEFRTKKGTLVAKGYLRVVYGDHGPYVEFLSKHMVREAWRTSVKKGPQAWYDECQPVDGSDCKLYLQKRDVKSLRNPPKGKYSVNNNRIGGYADYRVGRLYISPDDLVVTPSNNHPNSGVTPSNPITPSTIKWIPDPSAPPESMLVIPVKVESAQMRLELGEIKNAPNQPVVTPSFSGVQEVITFAGTSHRFGPKLGGYSQASHDRVFRVAMRVLKGLQVKLSGPHSELGEFLGGIVAPYETGNNPLIHVISGMALGWDQMLALACVELGIPFTASVPLRGFQMRWPERSIEVYESLLEEAASVVYVDELEDAKYKKLNRFMKPGLYSPIKMQTRNVHMVDNCDALLALWDGSSGGTGNCIQYANQVGKPWRNFWDFYSKEG